MGLTSSGKTNHRFCHASAAACSRRTTIKMTEERQSFFRVFRYFCFALLREFLLAIARMAGPAKRNQKVLPLHPAPASPGFVLSAVAPRVAVQGPSMALYGGTPSSLAASMPLAPLRDDSVHPPEGAIGVA